MSRSQFRILACAALLSTAATCPPRPPTPVPPAPVTVNVDVVVHCASKPATEVSVALAGQTKHTNTADGWVRFVVLKSLVGAQPVQIGAFPGCLPLASSAVLDGENHEAGGTPDAFTFALPIDQPPPPPIPVKATGVDVLYGVDNFVNLLDGAGKPIFTAEHFGLSADARKDSIARQVAEGSTHIKVSAEYRQPYPGSPVVGYDLINEPLRLRGELIALLETPSASGKGFVPILFLSSCDRGTEPDIDRWDAALQAIADLQPYIQIVPGWECVGPGGNWRSVSYFKAARKISQYLPTAYLFGHGVPKRTNWASNPVEPDDPVQGDEIQAWKAFGGEKFVGWHYQNAHGDEVLKTPCEPLDPTCWKNRWSMVVPRLGAGRCNGDDLGQGTPCGWRPIVLWYSESVNGDFHRQSDPRATSAKAISLAREARAICDQYGVRCGFGNGNPGPR